MIMERAEFIAVATVVCKHNPHLKGISPTHLADSMESRAYCLTKPGYMATAGYMLTAYTHPTGELAIKPSISHILF